MNARDELNKKAVLAAVARGFSVPARSQIERVGCLAALRAALARLKIDCVLDVGGNRGQFGSDLRDIGYRGWIVSFEPSLEDLIVLKQRADRRWVSYQIALGNEDGERELNIGNLTVLNSFLVPHDKRIVKTVSVKVMRLARMWPEIIKLTGTQRPFIKIDTQGFDVEVLKGAGEATRMFLGLMSELSLIPLYAGMPHYLEALEFYESLGFKLHSLYAVTRDENGAVVEYDGLLLRDGVVTEGAPEAQDVPGTHVGSQ